VLSSILLLALCFNDGDLTEDFEGAGSESWERVVSDAHPPYNIVERVHDPGQAKSGNQYLHFRTMGGSTAVRRSSRHAWPAEAGRPYRAGVWVRLSGQKHNSAVLSLTWVNAAGDVLSEQRSEPLTKTEGWTRLWLEVPLSPPGATGVLPGLHFEGPDVRGLCDFDLLQVEATERLDVRPAGRSMALFTTEEYPRFTLTPSGVPPGIHAITATLTTADGKTLTRTTTIDLPSTRSVSIDFPPLPPGMHGVKASVDGTEAWRSLFALVTLPGQLPAEAPAYERSERPLYPHGEAALQHRILKPHDPMVLDPLFFTDGGTPTCAYFGLRLIDQVLAGAEPMADPGLFPRGVRVAAFRKGASVLFAVWSDDEPVELTLPVNEGRLLRLGLVTPRVLRPGEKITLDGWPVFILDVDPLLTYLTLELSSALVPLQLSPSRLALRLHNRSHGETPREVTVGLDELPAGWRASTRRFNIATLAPDAVHEETLDLIVPPTELERTVDLKFSLTFTIQGRELSIQATRPLTVKSPLRIESVLGTGTARTLSLRIANGSDHAMTLSIRSRIPGLAERLDLVRDLGPGSRTKPLEFPVPDGGSADIFVQEAGGDRALCRRLIPLRGP